MHIHTSISVFFCIALSLILGCNPPAAQKTSPASKSSTKTTAPKDTLSTETTESPKEEVNYTNSLANSSNEVNQQDAKIISSVQNSQSLMATIGRISKRPVNPTRIDEFYKCGTYLSVSNITPNPADGADNSPLTVATQMKSAFAVISKDVLGTKIGAFQPYSVAVDTLGNIFVFYTANTSQDVLYSWQAPNSTQWAAPVSLTNLKDFKGIPTSTYDTTAKKVVAQVFNTVDRKLYTYNQGSGTTFASSGTPTTSNLNSFDELQGKNGVNLESNYSISLNAIAIPSEAGESIFTRIMNDVFTLGTAEIANALHDESVSQAQQVFNDIASKICPPPAN